MKIVTHAQGTAEWAAARAGICTASELDQLVTPHLELRKGEMLGTYVARKAAERWLGQPITVGGTWEMEQGSLLEEEAIPALELDLGHRVERVGLLLADDGSFGASPDAMISSTVGAEIKCPRPHTHVKWLVGGIVPPEHRLQCFGGMFVSGAQEWVFRSYCRGFPPFTARLARDDDAMKAIAGALEQFNRMVSVAMNKLVEANGGTGPASKIEDFEHPF